MDDWIEERGLVCLVNSQDFTAGMIQDTFGPKSFDINLIEIFLIILYKLIYDMPHRRLNREIPTYLTPSKSPAATANVHAAVAFGVRKESGRG